MQVCLEETTLQILSHSGGRSKPRGGLGDGNAIALATEAKICALSVLPLNSRLAR